MLVITPTTAEKNSIVTGRQYGVRMLGGTSNSYIRNSDVYGIGNFVNRQPFRFQGRGKLFTYKSKFGNGLPSAMYIQDAFLRPRCSEFNSSALNLWFVNGTMEMQNYAYNTFLEPSESQIKGRGKTLFNIYGGKNFFQTKAFNPNSLYMEMEFNIPNRVLPNTIQGSLAPLMMQAQENYFNFLDINSLTPNNGSIIAKPNANFNYSVFQKINSIKQDIELVTNPYTFKYANFTMDKDESCVNEKHVLSTNGGGTGTGSGGGGVIIRYPSQHDPNYRPS